jgi:transcriptional regulator with XRE-family HTH domain
MQEKKYKYGKIIKKAREFHNISARQLALRIGCTPANISKIENDKSLPSPALIKSICEVLKLPTEVFGIESYDPVAALESLIMLVQSQRDPHTTRIFDYLIKFFIHNQTKFLGNLSEKLYPAEDSNKELSDKEREKLLEKYDQIEDMLTTINTYWFNDQTFKDLKSVKKIEQPEISRY